MSSQDCSVHVQVEPQAPNRPGRAHVRRLRKNRRHIYRAGRSLWAFLLGLMLSSLFGAVMFFLHEHILWFCMFTTLTLAFVLAFGAGLFVPMRVVMLLMVPPMLSAQGKNLLLFLCVTTLMAGPLANTLENIRRASASLACGAELTANQTRTLMRRSAEPLFSALDKIQEITSNAYAVAGRVQDLITALTDNVRHVARTLRNVMHFLVEIGDVCNEKLGAPYRRCVDLFTAAQEDCVDLLGKLDFLCEIVTGFQALCHIARVAEIFCTIPTYIATQLRERLAEPAVAAFQRMKREFEFNVSIDAAFDLDADSDRSLHQTTQEIVETVSSELQTLRWLSGLLSYGGVVLFLIHFLRAISYRRRYLDDFHFDNFYISAQFRTLEQQVTEDGAHALPLTHRETRTYITPCSWKLTSKECQGVATRVFSVMKHVVLALVLISLDHLVFWILDLVYGDVLGDLVVRAPVTLMLQVDGSGFASDIFRDMVASFNTLQGGNITVVSRKCLLKPSRPNTTTSVSIGLMLLLALLVSVAGGYMLRCRRLICASYNPRRERNRVHFLHRYILDQRESEGLALKKSAVWSWSRPGRGPGGPGGRLHTWLLRVPGGALLSDLLGLTTDPCLACGERARSARDMVACEVPECAGRFCRTCFHSLGDCCVICVSSEDNEEELDWSDQEQQQVWDSAQNRPREPNLIAMMDMRRTRNKTRAPLSEADMAYQDDDDDDSGSGSLGLSQVVVQGARSSLGMDRTSSDPLEGTSTMWQNPTQPGATPDPPENPGLMWQWLNWFSSWWDDGS